MSTLKKKTAILADQMKNMYEWEKAAFLLFCLQLACVVFFNLSDLRLALDADFAATVYHGREIVRNGSLFLPDWHYTTTMEFDGALLFAVPLYAVTGNIFLSFGLADLLFVAIFIVVIWSILEHFDVTYGIRFIVETLVITPYAYGWLDYFKMLFFAHANYSVKVLVPLLLVLYLLRRQRVCLFFYLLLLAITCISSGTYTVVCGVAPVLAVMLLNLWKDLGAGTDRVKAEARALAPLYAGSILTAGAGILIHKKVYPGKIVTLLTKGSSFTDSIAAVFRGYYQVAGALTEEDVVAFSATGLYHCAKIMLVSFLLFFAVRTTYGWLKGDVKSGNRMLLCAHFWFNTVIMILGDMRFGGTDVQSRYLLIGFVPLLILAGTELQEMTGKMEAIRKTILMACVLAVILLIGCGNNVKLQKNLGYAEYAIQMTDYFDTLDADAVIFANDRDTAFFCRAMDENKHYGCYSSETNSLERLINSYGWESNLSAFGNRIAFAIPYYDEPETYFPPEITQKLRYEGQVRWLAVYLSE